MNPLDRLTTIISELMGKEPSDPDVRKAVVEVVMAIRAPKRRTLDELCAARYLDALLTEGEG